MTVSVRIEQLSHALGLSLPDYATKGSAGVDLQAAIAKGEPLVLGASKRVLVPTGIKLAIPKGFEAQIRPRSGMALKHGIIVPNSPGTIDSDYRGEVGVILCNLGDEAFTIERGMRIAQMVFAAVEHVEWEVSSVGGAETARSSGGFGSTGNISTRYIF